jgi:hypothetical protein
MTTGEIRASKRAETRDVAYWFALKTVIALVMVLSALAISGWHLPRAAPATPIDPVPLANAYVLVNARGEMTSNLLTQRRASSEVAKWNHGDYHVPAAQLPVHAVEVYVIPIDTVRKR